MKLKQLALTSLLALPFGAQAIINGTEVSRVDHQNIVEMNCTGSIVGGKWILTAAHCGIDNGISEPIYLADGSIVYAKKILEHPDYVVNNVDIGLMELASAPETNQVSLLKPTDMTLGETLHAYGFGGTGSTLSYAVQTVGIPFAYTPPAPWVIASDYAGQGDSTGGDSGMAYLDVDGYIRAIHSRANTNDPLGLEGTHLSYAVDFILDNVNAWSYPTRLNVNGSEVIKVQSLHRGTVNDTAYTEGDVTIDYALSTCDDAVVVEFDVCEYHITSTGGLGKLFLTSDEIIEVNVPESTPDPDTAPPSSGGGSGGTTSILTLLGLACLLRKRIS